MDQRDGSVRVDNAEEARMFLTRWVFSPLNGVLFGDWLRLVANHGRAITPAYWPRAGMATAMSMLNSLVRPVEDLRFGRLLDSVRVERPVFVLGHHRSGTTHLWNLLTQDPQFAYPTILQAMFPHSFLSFEGVLQGLAAPLAIRKRPQDNVRISPDAPLEEERALCTQTFLSIQMARHFPGHRAQFERFLTMRDATDAERARWRRAFSRFSQKLLLRHGLDRTLVFKSPDHTGKIRLILELFPDARFIHIHRHPYTVFASTQKMERLTQPIYAFQPTSLDAQDDFILWRYRRMYDAFFEDRDLIPAGQFAEIAFRDLEREPVEQMEAVYRTLGLPGFHRARPRLEAYLAGIAGYRKNAHAHLPPPIRRRIQSEWSESFDRWGYEA